MVVLAAATDFVVFEDNGCMVVLAAATDFVVFEDNGCMVVLAAPASIKVGMLKDD
jgi:hypothetical protein